MRKSAGEIRLLLGSRPTVGRMSVTERPTGERGSAPPGGRRDARRRLRRGLPPGVRLTRRGWQVLRVVVVAVGLLAVWVTWSIGSVLSAPGHDTVAARLAEWGRDHGLGVVVLAMEKVQYAAHPPVQGGKPPPGELQPTGTSGHRAASGAGAGATGAGLAIRPTLRPFARPALAGEGVWHSLRQVKGQPAVQATYLRPDNIHTSYLTGVVWLSHRLLHFDLHPGWDQPGGHWKVPDWIAPGKRRGLVATWNGAFKIADARGGFYLDGRTAGTLRRGAASEVFYRNGSMTVGRWGSQVRMSPQVIGVRQNLGLLVDHGRLAANIDNSPEFNWGLTLGGAYYVFRSGVGVTAGGDLVYASGDALSAQSLARILQRAGCVRAMELDINPAWVSFMSYHTHRDPANPAPTRLLRDYQRPANRYYTHTSRDFVAVYGR